jgi:hypothetical protein
MKGLIALPILALALVGCTPLPEQIAPAGVPPVESSMPDGDTAVCSPWPDCMDYQPMPIPGPEYSLPVPPGGEGPVAP